MIERVALATALAFGAAACSQDDAAEPFHGTIAGEPFAPVDATGFVMDAMTCEQLIGPFGTPTATMVEVRFGDFDGVCDLAIDTACCGDKASARSAYVAVARVNDHGGPVPPIGPGTYVDGPAVTDENGVVDFVWMGLRSSDAACASVATGMYKEPTGGSVTFQQLSSTRIPGHAELRFDNGDVLSGTFDVPVCGAQDEVYCASLKGGCISPACVP